ncbi:MAG: recombinase RecT [Smithella sp.]|nr:recombinase RecT [Smithella sp.]
MSKNAVALKSEISDVVAKKVRQFQQSGELHLPANYSPENAMKSAWLILQSTQDRDKNPVLSTCTKESIMNSLLDMVVQGLNPAKKQCYFIAYGKELACQRSYFGTMALAKQVDDSIADIIAEVVYEGDTFKYGINRGKKEITEHTQALENVNSKKIKAAYCLIINTDGEVIKTDIMTMDEIKKAWSQSQMKPIGENGQIKAGSTHDKFTADMAKKTVINRACKAIINSSSDSHLLRVSANRSDEIRAEVEVAEEIEENANTTPIDIVEAEYEDLPADEPEQEEGQQQAMDGPDF